MKKIFIAISLMFVSQGVWLQPVHAQPAEIKQLKTEDIQATTVTLKYKNINAAKKFKFELFDKRAGRTEYRKVKTFLKKRQNKSNSYFTLELTELKPNRDYQIRYRPIYLGDRLGVWSDFRKFKTTYEGVYFTVTLPEPLTNGDVPYITVLDSSHTTATSGGYPLAAIDDTTYAGVVDGVTVGDNLHVVASRNSSEPSAFEQFTPDDPEQYRTVEVTAIPTYAEFSVTGWRWGTNPTTTSDISTENWPITARDRFVLSTELNPVYNEAATDLTASTMAAIAANGSKYVTIHSATRMITQGDPVETTEKDIPYYPTETELEALVTAAQAAGLTPILAIDIPINPDNEETILADMAGTHANDYFSTYLTRWREAMNDGVDFATAHNIGIVVLNTDFYDFTFADDAQQYYFDYVLQNDILPVVAENYTGILTTADFNTDADFTWYGAPEIDWIGDTWYPDLTDSTTPTIANMYTAALTQFNGTYASANTTYGKPIYFHQLGVMSWDGAAAAGETVTPDNAAIDPDQAVNEEYAFDYQEQADAYEALFRAIADTSFVVGASAVNYTYYIQYDKIANMRSKPAEQVWSRWGALLTTAGL